MPSTSNRFVKALTLASIVVLVATCTDSQLPTPPDVGAPSFDISHGGNGGNEDVFFSPPLTESPDGTVCFGLPCLGAGLFGDRPVNPNLAPEAHICEMFVGEKPNHTKDDECNPDGDFDALDMTFNATGGFYSANLKDVEFADGEWNVERHYRIAIMLGSLELAFRDMDPDEGPSTASCDDRVRYCQFNVGGSGSTPVKVFIESGAACWFSGASQAILDLCATASFDLSQGGTLALQELEGNQIQTLATAVAPAGGTGTSNVTMQPCLTPGGNLSQVLDIPLFGDCIEITGDAPVPNGIASLCNVGDGAVASATQAKRISILRASEFLLTDTDSIVADNGSFWKVVTLPDADAACPDPVIVTLGTFDRLQLLARNAWRSAKTQVVDWLSPSPLLASMCNRGCGGSGNFESSYQAGLPPWIEALTLTDLGKREVDEVVTATIKAWDSGELEGTTTKVPEPVKDVRLWVTVTEGTGTVSSGMLETDSTGIATFQFTVGPGLNEVTVTGRGVGDPTTNLPTKAFTPLHELGEDADEVPVGVGKLTFTAIGPVPMFFETQPQDVDGFDGMATLKPFTVCTLGSDIEGYPITLIVAVNNNGSFVELTGEDFDDTKTGADGCITFSTLEINKTGAYRLVVNPVFNSRDKVVDGDAFSEKFNVKP